MINLIHYALIAALIGLFWPLGVLVAVPLAVGAVTVWGITKLQN